MAVRAEVARSGIGFGAVLAIVISWSNNSSILWAIVHGVLSWLYVIYYAATRENLWLRHLLTTVAQEL